MSETPVEPVAPSEAAKPRSGRAPLWRRRPVQLLAGAALLAAGVGVYFAVRGGADQVHVRGTLQLGPFGSSDSVHPGSAANGDACVATGGFGDISAGTAVTVGGSRGQTLGVGALGGGVEANVDTSLGSPMGYCVFAFDVAVPGGQSAYTVTISHRGTQSFTPGQVAAGIHLALQ